mgnify:CR=1 FL=1
MDTLKSLAQIPIVTVGTARTSFGQGTQNGGVGAQMDLLVLGDAPRQAAGLVAEGLTFAGAVEGATARFRIHVDALRTTAWGVNLRTSSLAVGQVCLVEIEGDLHATLVVDITAIANSGDAEITLSPAIPELDRVELDIEVFSRAIASSQIEDVAVVENNIVVANALGQAEVLVAGVLSGRGADTRVVVEAEGIPLARTVLSTNIKYPKANASVPVPQSSITLDGPLPEEWKNLDLNIWYAPVPAGTLKKLPKLTWTLADLESPLPVEFTDPSATTLPPNTPIVLIDAKGKLVTCRGTLTTLDGTTTFAVTEFLSGSGPLVPPITAYTGLSRVTRGKTVRDEIIGSGDTSATFQTFALAKSPLTYLATPEGPEPQLEVYVNGELWTRAPSFHGATPQDAIYTIRHDADHQTLITFGDGELGRRLPTGVDNVVATYRYGVGGNAPAGTSVTLEKPIPGIRKLLSPLPAIGGRDVPPPREAQRAAIRSTPDSSAMPAWHSLSTHDSPSMHRPMGQLGGSLGATAAVGTSRRGFGSGTWIDAGAVGIVVEAMLENVVRDVGASKASIRHTGRPNLRTHFIARGGILPVDTFAQPRRATPLDAPTKAPVDNARMPTLPAIEVIRERVDTATIALDLRGHARPIARRLGRAALARLRGARGVGHRLESRLALRGPRLLGDARLALVVHTRQALDA